MSGLCEICNREKRGFGFKQPRQRVDYLGHSLAQPLTIDKSLKHFCSMICQDIFYELYCKRVIVNKTDVEIKAEQSVLKPLGDFVADIGLDVPLRDYSKEQINALVSTIVDSYHKELQRLTKDEIPF